MFCLEMSPRQLNLLLMMTQVCLFLAIIIISVVFINKLGWWRGIVGNAFRLKQS